MSNVLSNQPLTFDIDPNLLEDRLDPMYYQPKYMEVIEKLEKLPNVVTLRHISKSVRYSDGKWELHTSDYVPKGVLLLQILNLRELSFFLDSPRNKYISEEKHQKWKNSQVKPGDIVMAITGIVGLSTLVPDNFPEANLNQALARINLKRHIILKNGEERSVNPQYITIFLNSNYGRSQTERFGSGRAVQSGLALSAIKETKIPIPPRKIQDKIAEIMQNADKERRAKLDRAEKLLNSINGIVLEELGIELPEIEDKKIFEVEPEDLEDRLDPLYYHPTYLKLLELIEMNPWDIKRLSEITKTITSGQRPKGGVKHIEKGVPSLGGEHITSSGDFNFEEIRFIPEEFHKGQKKSQVRHFDVLIVKDGATTGKVAIIPEDFPLKQCNINEHLFKITLENGYDPYYIFCYLFSDLGQKQINRLISGAAQMGITRDAVSEIKIITPPSEIQDNIGEEVKRRKEEFKRLTKEADEVIENAKRRIEQIILKGENIS